MDDPKFCAKHSKLGAAMVELLKLGVKPSDWRGPSSVYTGSLVALENCRDCWALNGCSHPPGQILPLLVCRKCGEWKDGERIAEFSDDALRATLAKMVPPR